MRTRNNENIWKLENPPKFGLIESYVTDPKRNWLLCGTDQGFYNLWDLRFQLLVRSWKDPHQTIIKKIVFGEGNKIFSSVSDTHNPLVHQWDLENLCCPLMFRVKTGEKDFELKNKEQYTNPLLFSQFDPNFHTLHKRNESVHHPTQYFESLVTDGSSFLFSAGTDQTIRMWNLKEPKNSKIVSSQINKTTKYFSIPGKRFSIVQENVISTNSDQSLPFSSFHVDDILDLKLIPSLNMLISCSRDSTIKIWK